MTERIFMVLRSMFRISLALIANKWLLVWLGQLLPKNYQKKTFPSKLRLNLTSILSNKNLLEIHEDDIFDPFLDSATYFMNKLWDFQFILTIGSKFNQKIVNKVIKKTLKTSFLTVYFK